MKIIDAHAHIGEDVVFDEELNEQDILRTMDRFGVHGAIVQPMICRPYLEAAKAANDRVHRFALAHPGRIWGMVSLNPHFAPEDFDAECARCVRELGFVGIKIATSAYGCNPSKRDGMHVFEVARGLGVPVMVHTGSGIPFADPVQLVAPARSFPDVSIVVAHGGGDLTMTQCIQLARDYENVYVEPSWTSILGIEAMMRTLGPGKLMFSTDMPQNTPVELAKYRSAIPDEGDLAQVLGGTCAQVFRLKETNA